MGLGTSAGAGALGWPVRLTLPVRPSGPRTLSRSPWGIGYGSRRSSRPLGGNRPQGRVGAPDPGQGNRGQESRRPPRDPHGRWPDRAGLPPGLAGDGRCKALACWTALRRPTPSAPPSCDSLATEAGRKVVRGHHGPEGSLETWTRACYDMNWVKEVGTVRGVGPKARRLPRGAIGMETMANQQGALSCPRSPRSDRRSASPMTTVHTLPR